MVTLSILDLQGRTLATLFEGSLSPGSSLTLEWDASASPAGLYFCRLKTEAGLQTRKVVLMK
jgi:hypothetical protein